VAEPLEDVLRDARACRFCEPELPLGANPVLRADARARLLIVGQAPGTKVHQTGVPWNDASGERLRHWLQVDRDTFYDTRRIAIVPMGFCYPGRDARGGDKPPRPECAPIWHPRLLAALPNLELTLLVGGYAQRYYLGKAARRTLRETVAAYANYLPAYLPLPHPSWRNTAWLNRNPWFEAELLPELRRRVHALL
jgi:uracil-DNA glycosylase